MEFLLKNGYHALLNEQIHKSEALKSDFHKSIEGEDKMKRVQALMGPRSFKNFLITVQKRQEDEIKTEEFMMPYRTR